MLRKRLGWTRVAPTLQIGSQTLARSMRPAGAGIYFLSMAKKNPKLAETGRLGAESVMASGTMSLAIKVASNRQRPLQGTGEGIFGPKEPATGSLTRRSLPITP